MAGLLDMEGLAGLCPDPDDTTGLDQSAIVGCSLASQLEETRVGLNTFFLLFGGALVFCMQAGFAMLCAGSVRQKNAKNIMLKNLLDACGGALGFFSVGWGLAYGGGEGLTFAGNSQFGLKGFLEDGGDFALFFFQFAFAATAATIVAGTVAERCKMAAYLCYSVFLTSFVYPIIAHAIWSSNGFLSAFAAEEDLFNDVGVVDFAGSGVVHMTGGLTALIAAIILGPRKGRFYDEDGNPLDEPHTFPAHSVSLQILGTFILWFGWYGFNPGSALAIFDSAYAQTAAVCAVTTTVAAASGCVSCMFFDSVVDAQKTGHVSYDLTCAMNGALGGLVAITAGTSTIAPAYATIVGAIGGILYWCFSKFLIKMKIDDAVDAIPVHFANGFWGVLAVGFFADPDYMDIVGYNSEKCGVFYGCGGDLLVAQLASLGFIIGWVTVLMTPFFLVLNALGMFRVDEIEEDVGLDISHHRGAAYDLSPAKEEDVERLIASHHGNVEPPKRVEQVVEPIEADEAEA